MTRKIELDLDLPKLPDYGEHGAEVTAHTEAKVESFRKNWLDKPATEEIQKLVDRVDAEKRREIVVPVADLWQNEGMLTRGNGGIILNEHTLKQLTSAQMHGNCKHNTKGVTKYLLDTWMPDCKRSITIGARFTEAESGTLSAYRINPKSGRGYTSYDVDRVARHLLESVQPGATAEVHYEPVSTRWSIEMVMQNPYEIGELGVGSTHSVGINLRGDDRGTQCITGSQAIKRWACMNGLILPHELNGFQLRHSGDFDKMRRAVDRIINSTEVMMRSFSERWSEAYERQIHADYNGTPVSAHECFKRLVAHKLVKVPGVKDRALYNMLCNAWDHEPGDSRAHVINAITRLHEEKTIPWYAMEELEETAGEMVFARNYTLKPLTKAQESNW